MEYSDIYDAVYDIFELCEDSDHATIELEDGYMLCARCYHFDIEIYLYKDLERINSMSLLGYTEGLSNLVSGEFDCITGFADFIWNAIYNLENKKEEDEW